MKHQKFLNTDQIINSNVFSEEDFFSEEEVYKEKYNDTIDSIQDFLNNKKVIERYDSRKKFKESDNDIIIGYGAKTGETYYEHISKGVNNIISQGRYYFRDTENPIELIKLCCLSYIIHDLNKMYNIYKNEIWSDTTVKEELMKLDDISDGMVSKILKWRDYIPDITSIIRLHDKDAEKQGREIRSNKISKSHVRLCGRILFVVDRLDLIHDLSPTFRFVGEDKNRKKKPIEINQSKKLQEITFILSKIVNDEVSIEKFKITSQATLFSNIILNLLVDTLEEEFYFHPLLVFTDGIIVWGSGKIGDIDSIVEKIARAFNVKFDDLIMSSDTIYQASNEAYKISEYAFQMPNAKNKIERAFRRLIEETMKPISKNSRKNAIKKMKKYYSNDMKKHPTLKRWFSEDTTTLIEDEPLWKVARLLDTIFFNTYNYIVKEYTSEEREVVMKRFLKHLKVLKPVEDFYDQFESTYFVYTYYFFHIIGNLLISQGRTFKELKEPCIEFIQNEIDKVEITKKVFEDGELEEIIKDSIQMLGTNRKASEITVDLICPAVYCTVCGKPMKDLGVSKNEESYRWRRAYLKQSVKAQKFSNRRIAGENKPPVRYICNKCKLISWLEKILSENEEGKNYFITYYLPSGYPYSAVKNIANILNEEKYSSSKEKLNVFTIDFTRYRKEGVIDLSGKSFGNGLELPKIKEEVGGKIVIPYIVNKETDIFEVLQYGLMIANNSNLKVTISKLPTDQQDVLQDNDITIQEMPSELRWLCCDQTTFSRDQGKIISDMLVEIEYIARNIFKKKFYKRTTDIVRSLENGKAINYLYSKIDKKEEKKNPKYRDIMANVIVNGVSKIYNLRSKLKEVI